MGHTYGIDPGAHPQRQMNETPGNPAAPAVVVGVDGTDTSWDAFWWACGESRRLGGRTVAVYVGSTSTAASAAGAGGAMVYSAMEQTVTDQAEDLCNQIRQYGGEHGVEIKFVHTAATSPRSFSALPSWSTPI